MDSLNGRTKKWMFQWVSMDVEVSGMRWMWFILALRCGKALNSPSRSQTIKRVRSTSNLFAAWNGETHILVGGLVAIFWIFPLILDCFHHANWRSHIFQRGGPKITNQHIFLNKNGGMRPESSRPNRFSHNSPVFLNHRSSFVNDHRWVKKSTGLGWTPVDHYLYGCSWPQLWTVLDIVRSEKFSQV